MAASAPASISNWITVPSRIRSSASSGAPWPRYALGPAFATPPTLPNSATMPCAKTGGTPSNRSVRPLPRRTFNSASRRETPSAMRSVIVCLSLNGFRTRTEWRGRDADPLTPDSASARSDTASLPSGRHATRNLYHCPGSFTDSRCAVSVLSRRTPSQ